MELWLAALNPEALDLVRRTPLAERLGRERMFFTVEQAVDAFMSRAATICADEHCFVITDGRNPHAYA